MLDVEMYANTFDGTDPEKYLGMYRCGNEPKPTGLSGKEKILIVIVIQNTTRYWMNFHKLVTWGNAVKLLSS